MRTIAIITLKFDLLALLKDPTQKKNSLIENLKAYFNMIK